MSIEFRCPHCQRLLRVPDGSEGKQAQCPQCQAMVQVPAPGAPPAAPSPTPGSPNPFPTNFPAAAAPPASDNPYQAPASAFAPQHAGVGPEIYPLVPTKMDLGDVLNRTWEIYKTQLGMMVLVGFVFIVMVYAFSFVMGLIQQAAIVAIGDPAAAIPLTLAGQPFQMLFQMWLGLGVFQYMLKIARGQAAEFTDIFTGLRFIVPAALGGLLLLLIGLAIILVCFGPAGLTYLLTKEEQISLIVAGVGLVVYLPIGFFLFYSVLQYQSLIIDRGLGPIESIKKSYEIMSGNRLMFFVLSLLLGIVNLLGCVACGFGLFFTMGFYQLAHAVAYLAITGQPTADQLMRGALPPVSSGPTV